MRVGAPRTPYLLLRLPRVDPRKKEFDMPPERSETDNFLAVIEAKIAALKALADSYRAALSLGALGQPGDVEPSGQLSISGAGSGASIELPQGALLGKSLPAAIKLHLSAVRRKQTTKEVAAALKAGGVESTSASFENTVATALHRLRTAGDVLKFNDGWGLAEFYPETLRNRIAAQSDGKKKVASPPRAKKRPSAKKHAAKLLALPIGEDEKQAG
jgi:hypothetical protein